MTTHLIADTGMQFLTTEVECNPSEPLMLPGGRMLRYHFCETIDELEERYVFDLLCAHDDGTTLLPVSELLRAPDAVERNGDGRELFDEAGMVRFSPKKDTMFFTTYSEDVEDDSVYCVSSLGQMVRNGQTGAMASVFDVLCDKWLPVPMYAQEMDGVSGLGPHGWCRVRMQRMGAGSKKGLERLRLVWAFDTQVADDDLSMLRPVFSEWGDATCHFSLCNRADLLLSFLQSGEDFHAIADYVASLFGVRTEDPEHSRRYKAFYIYFVNYLRLLPGAAPQVALHRNAHPPIDVDLVLDIGNSRTCGILFEEGRFENAKMLELRNLSEPWVTYENRTFDMRVVFRKADFGNDIALEESMFQWHSFVRVGEEARRLIYGAVDENDNVARLTTNHSSPKRYLWDEEPFEGQWENLRLEGDAFNQRQTGDVYVDGLSECFDERGAFTADGDGIGGRHYSRASLMTFAFIEIYAQALGQVNSVKFRERWGNVDCRRNLRSIIVTCPTAMPLREQRKLRRCAEEAWQALCACTPCLPPATVIPSSASLTPKPYALTGEGRVWSYDEASCCQLVYLYAEIAQRYKGEIGRFFETKGRLRPDMDPERKSLTIGSVDIGDGTTDLMVCNYRYDGEGNATVTPTPLFWDSYCLAGSDILRSLVQNLLIEGPDQGLTDQGNITSVLTARLRAMSDDQLKALPRVQDNPVYSKIVRDLCDAPDARERDNQLRHFVADLMHHFFCGDNANQTENDRRQRLAFNTQVSLPIVQQFMQMLHDHRPSRLYSFDELFPDVKPARHLLDHFAHHFGFRFEELRWRFDPQRTADLVKAAMEPLLRQLAMVLYSQQCDFIVLAGRPTSLDAITELFIKYLPTTPDRLVRLNEYRVGKFFPTARPEGYFYDPKAIVAVGGMVAHLAQSHQLKHLPLDFTEMIKQMSSTAHYIGEYQGVRQRVEEAVITPDCSTATLDIHAFPFFIGCRQLDASAYQARPLWAIRNHSAHSPLRITLVREDGRNQPEELRLMDAMTREGRSVKAQVELVPQTLVDDGKHWLDKGEFVLEIAGQQQRI